MCAEICLHGQILGTHSFLLRDGFVEPDEYAEIKEKYFLPGGETGTAATVLSSLGASVKMDGTHIGTEVARCSSPSTQTSLSICRPSSLTPIMRA